MPLFDKPPVHNFPDRAFREALEQVQNLRDVLVEAVDLKQREEVRTMSETTKQTWAQMYEAQANARADARALRQGELKGELNERRELLITLLGDAFGELPESLTTSIRACEDADRLKVAIRKLRTLTALDQFQL